MAKFRKKPVVIDAVQFRGPQVSDVDYMLAFDDWMVLMDERVMLNKAAMSKFGIYLGEVTLAFTKP